MAAADEAQHLGAALVELVVADRADVEAEQVGRLDRGLVVEPGRDQRRRADGVAGVGDDRALGIGGLGLGEVAAQVRDAAGGLSREPSIPMRR
jgi:hypothetical protein